jgi:hypothetical protein
MIKEQVLDFLIKTPFEGKTPTQIGIGIGKSYSSASASVAPCLKFLIKEGKVKRYKDDNKVKYRIV